MVAKRKDVILMVAQQPEDLLLTGVRKEVLRSLALASG